MRGSVFRAIGVLALIFTAALVGPLPAYAAADQPDIAVTMTPAGAVTVHANDTVAVSVTLTNIGKASASPFNVVFDASGLSQTIDVATAATGCNRSQRRYTCQVGALNPAGAASLQFSLKVAATAQAGSGGSIHVTANLNGDADSTNNDRIATFTIAGAADAGADLAGSNDSPAGDVGDVVTVHVTVTNNGPGDSGLYSVLIAPDPGLKLVSATSVRGCTTTVNPAECRGGNMSGGESNAFTLKFEVLALQDQYCGLSLKTARPDPDPDNNGLCGGAHGIVTPPEPPAPVETDAGGATQPTRPRTNGTASADIDPFVHATASATAAPSTVAADDSPRSSMGFTAAVTSAAVSTLSLGVALLLAALIITLHRRRPLGLRLAGLTHALPWDRGGATPRVSSHRERPRPAHRPGPAEQPTAVTNPVPPAQPSADAEPTEPTDTIIRPDIP